MLPIAKPGGTLRAELALDALEMAIWRAGDGLGKEKLIHHSEPVQDTSIRYAQRLQEIKAMRSAGSKGDCDNAAAESLNSLRAGMHLRKNSRKNTTRAGKSW